VKGFAALIQAWAQLPQQPIATQLTIFGDGSLRTELRQLVSRLGLRNDIALAGFHTNMASAYPRADLVVISSEREGFPYVLIESLLAGCPVISSPVSGAADVLPPQALSPDHQVTSLTRLISSALANLTELKAAEGPAMAFARETLTLDHMTDETEQLYLDALAAPNMW
jgi:glycosyltransferase involved in cell wall biosynthesis